jgi:hypothetical protein
MKSTDQILDFFQREVEYEGTSHANCVYLNDLKIELPRNTYEVPHFSTTNEELFDADFSCILEALNFPDRWMDLVVQNEVDCPNPPRVTSIQFLESQTRVMDMIVNLTNCDMYGELPDDAVSANLTLFRFCDESGYEPGDITLRIGVGYTLYTDMEYVEEGTIDWGD